MDRDISKARAKRDWRGQFALAIDPVKPMQYRKSSKPGLKDVCTMCGEYCSMKRTEKCLGRK
jgi:phosphomethylpyrimidine synthase